MGQVIKPVIYEQLSVNVLDGRLKHIIMPAFVRVGMLYQHFIIISTFRYGQNVIFILTGSTTRCHIMPYSTFNILIAYLSDN